jgi:hypothetical protein
MKDLHRDCNRMMSGHPTDPDQWVLELAVMYANKLREVEAARSDELRRHHLRLLRHFYEAAIDEASYEENKRMLRLPSDIRERLQSTGSSPPIRAITATEAECIRRACSVPPVGALENLTGEDCISLADLYEGWAQDNRFDSAGMVRLLGWADGARNLAAAIGGDYQPPAKVPGEPDSLLKFLVRRMNEK